MKIGVDIGGTKTRAGLIEGKKIYKKIELLTEAKKGKEKVIRNITRAISHVLDKRAEGIGVGIAGLVSKNKVTKTPNLPLNNFDIKKYIEKKFRKKTAVENDSRCAALAEAKYGAGKGYRNMVMITLGTGVGGGIIIDGKIYRGKGNAGEIGHMTIKHDGIKSRCCNNHGCLEELTSARAVKRYFGENINPLEIEKMALMGDKKAIRAYEEMGRNLGIGIANIANILSPEIIVIGGGIANAWKLFEKEMNKEIRKRSFAKTKVARAKIKDAGIIGAALHLTSL